MLHGVSLLFCGLFSQSYNKHNRRYNFLMLLVKLYAPYAFFKGWWGPFSACVSLTRLLFKLSFWTLKFSNNHVSFPTTETFPPINDAFYLLMMLYQLDTKHNEYAPCLCTHKDAQNQLGQKGKKLTLGARTRTTTHSNKTSTITNTVDNTRTMRRSPNTIAFSNEMVHEVCRLRIIRVAGGGGTMPDVQVACTTTK